MRNVHDQKYSEIDAKNEALRLTRKEKFKKGKVPTSSIQYEAYECEQCNCWHVREKVTKSKTQPLCQESFSIRV